MNSDPDTWKNPANRSLSAHVGESPKRWIIDCVDCNAPVEPWQTQGYRFGYCKACFDTLMKPDGLV
ncbi:hypothetical protein QO002_001604 [Pararhizobium capsulatum DSM 1112]|uniref:Uncharacterized protein n=1 Tax=Pararhizobium capsulatum DSM 1112 TaxID=1121113 RepID=A0ABU0BMI9_9HYPH|nr:hypothetical protein [Pararhizobium capsulatum]MDQ0319466.1 hypothetical protein [Pararhizobium capsulatum DSM 1112]